MTTVTHNISNNIFNEHNVKLALDAGNLLVNSCLVPPKYRLIAAAAIAAGVYVARTKFFNTAS